MRNRREGYPINKTSLASMSIWRMHSQQLLLMMPHKTFSMYNSVRRMLSKYHHLFRPLRGVNSCGLIPAAGAGPCPREEADRSSAPMRNQNIVTKYSDPTIEMSA